MNFFPKPNFSRSDANALAQCQFTPEALDQMRWAGVTDDYIEREPSKLNVFDVESDLCQSLTLSLSVKDGKALSQNRHYSPCPAVSELASTLPDGAEIEVIIRTKKVIL